MSELLRYTMFQEVLFPADSERDSGHTASDLTLNKVVRFSLSEDQLIRSADLVLFDFETTGLDPREDRIIEIGGQRISHGEVVEEFSTLVNPGRPISEQITKITGITNEMLADKPTAAEVLPKFLHFIDSALLVAHNAEFDMAFLSESCQRLGYHINWPCFCTLKLSRILLPQLESRTLDSLAAHYGLSFEARHRSIGDVKVTRSVLDNLLAKEGAHIETWKQLQAVAGIRD